MKKDILVLMKLLSHLFFYEMVHSSIMCKRSLFTKNNIHYRKRPTEDYDLFIRLAKAGMRAGRLDKKLIKQRKHQAACGSDWDNIKKDIDLMRIELVRDLGIDLQIMKKVTYCIVDQNLSIYVNINLEMFLLG